jgi:hypothetical protein
VPSRLAQADKHVTACSWHRKGRSAIEYKDYLNAWQQAHAQNCQAFDYFIKSVNESVPRSYPGIFSTAGFENDAFPKLTADEQLGTASFVFGGKTVDVTLRTVQTDPKSLSFLGEFRFNLSGDDAAYHVITFNDRGQWYEQRPDGRMQERNFRSRDGKVGQEAAIGYGGLPAQRIVRIGDQCAWPYPQNCREYRV